MTSRELTGFLPLDEAQPVDSDLRRRLSDTAWRLTFGAIGWPWLLASLSGGRPADKRALLDELGLAHDALPHLGSWKADVGFLRHIVREIARLRPAHVVELGAGASSLIAARALQLHGGGRLHSFDQHGGFVDATRQWLADHALDVDIRHAPLTHESADWPGRWYAIDRLPDQIDLIIIDGPPWSVHPLVRGAADSLFARLSPDGVVLLDDAARPGERMVARRWRQRWPHIDFRLMKDGTKGTLVGRRRDTSQPVANDNEDGRTWRHLGRVAAIAALVATGWIARGTLGEFPQAAQASSFLDEAAASRRAGLLRQTMASQVESARFDAQEIERSTGIILPPLPAGWRVTDAQLFPTADSPAIAMSVTTPQGEALSLFADRAETPAEATPLMARRAGETIAYWEQGTMAYALTGQGEARRIMQLAGTIAPGD
ncbi:class I SAM-dependent methyltransferase [Sphingobium sp. HBC34]|uniref:Class I SAM-dependent methyltransferase n=1 Tax=Sphingobium cyanobacteriorum TaxID=3063954 RepID=A0ABT8ZKA2_9SPHN|nr:class I SAM-dependent methyltransferase [Sphingobium sp. HBC34]MDO7834220.1 class I SAM-dependent methyltransferase [Sphingobium sp. HBC34]